MQVTIWRGTKEIGGSCVEVVSEGTRIILDMGMPLVDENQEQFDDKKYEKYTTQMLFDEGIVPKVSGIYPGVDDHPRPDAVLISHAHKDHYGFLGHIDPDVPVYLSEGTSILIEVTNEFTSQDIHIQNKFIVRAGTEFSIGNFTIRPFLVDHSAVDALAFEITDGNKTILYTGDFRAHGHKGPTTTEYLLSNATPEPDGLIMEGTMMGRAEEHVRTEKELLAEATQMFENTPGPVFVNQSGQNIDRLVSFYRAAQASGRTLLIDPYVAWVLKQLSGHKDMSGLPSVEKDSSGIRVFYPHFLKGKPKIAFTFKHAKIEYTELVDMSGCYVMLVRPTMLQFLGKLVREGASFSDGVCVYSQWGGYKDDTRMQKLFKFMDANDVQHYDLHTSGHAKVEDLDNLVTRLSPKKLIPIHTFHPDEFSRFSETVVTTTDGQVIEI